MTQQDVIDAIRRDDKLFAEIVAGMANFVREIEGNGGVMDEFVHKLADILGDDPAAKDACWSFRDAIFSAISIA